MQLERQRDCAYDGVGRGSVSSPALRRPRPVGSPPRARRSKFSKPYDLISLAAYDILWATEDGADNLRCTHVSVANADHDKDLRKMRSGRLWPATAFSGVQR